MFKVVDNKIYKVEVKFENDDLQLTVRLIALNYLDKFKKAISIIETNYLKVDCYWLEVKRDIDNKKMFKNLNWTKENISEYLHIELLFSNETGQDDCHFYNIIKTLKENI